MYVWAMRDKGSEWRAAAAIAKRGPLPFTPLVEAVCEPFMPRAETPVANPVDVVSKLIRRANALTDSGRVWVDFNHLRLVFSAADVAELHHVARGYRLFGRNLLTPVVRTSSDTPVVEAVAEWAAAEGCGVCIRVDGTTSLAERADDVLRLLNELGIPIEEVDLVVDAQDLPRLAGFDLLTEAFPQSALARNWVVLGGTFPSSITEYSPDDYEHLIERAEWSAWVEESGKLGGGRIPTYGDFATQPARYTPSPGYPGSASVRYSTEENFVLLRGRGGKRVDYNQYIGHARYLKTRPYFRRAADTAADDYVEWIATGRNRTGSQQTWRVASFQRHVGVVRSQLSLFRLAVVR